MNKRRKIERYLPNTYFINKTIQHTPQARRSVLMPPENTYKTFYLIINIKDTE